MRAVEQRFNGSQRHHDTMGKVTVTTEKAPSRRSGGHRQAWPVRLGLLLTGASIAVLLSYPGGGSGGGWQRGSHHLTHGFMLAPLE